MLLCLYENLFSVWHGAVEIFGVLKTSSVIVRSQHCPICLNSFEHCVFGFAFLTFPLANLQFLVKWKHALGASLFPSTPITISDLRPRKAPLNIHHSLPSLCPSATVFIAIVIKQTAHLIPGRDCHHSPETHSLHVNPAIRRKVYGPRSLLLLIIIAGNIPGAHHPRRGTAGISTKFS